MKYKYISNYKQFEDEEVEALKTIIEKKKNKDCNNILEVGTKAGLVTMMLSDLSEKVTSIDNEVFWSPSTRDHLALNIIHNVNYYQTDNVAKKVEETIGDKPEVIYMDTPELSKSKVIDLVKNTQKKFSDYKSVLLISRNEGKFDVEVIEEQKKTTRKKQSVEKEPTA